MDVMVKMVIYNHCAVSDKALPLQKQSKVDSV